MTDIIPGSSIITFADVERMRPLWRDATPKTFWNLLDATFMQGESISPFSAGPIVVFTTRRSQDELLATIGMGIWGFSEKHDSTKRFLWNSGSQRYEYHNGTVISLFMLHDLVDKVEETVRSQVRSVTGQLISGDISISSWTVTMSKLVKDVHTLSGVTAQGGWNQFGISDWQYMGSIIKKQHNYLNRFASELESGQLLLNARAFVRADAYMRSSYLTFEEMRRRNAQNSGVKNEERRILGGENPCSDCLSYADEGWQAISTLPSLGQSECIFNCRCHFEFRFNPDRLAWAYRGRDVTPGVDVPPPSAFGS